MRHREKLLEYYRNIFSQLGVILIGIGVSLFIFFFQQNYQDQRKRETELQLVLAKLAARIARGAPVVESLGEFDALLDDGGAYIIRTSVERTTRSARTERNSPSRSPRSFWSSATLTFKSSRS